MSFLCPLLGLICGILIGNFLDSPLFALVMILIGVGIYLLILNNSSDPITAFKFNKYHRVWIFILFCGLGQADYVFKAPTILPDEDLKNYKVAYGEIIEVFSFAEGDQFYIDIRSLTENSGKTIKTSNLIIRLVTDGFSATEGDVILFPINLKKIKDNPNFRSNGFKDRMQKKGIIYTSEASCTKISIVESTKSVSSFFNRLKNNLIIRTEKTRLSKSCKGFLIALFWGDKTSLNSEVKEKFSKIGVAHVLALSGMHVAILVGILSAIFLPLNYYFNRNLRLWLVLNLLWFYVLITGCSFSTVRAALMMSFVVLSLTYQRKGDAFNSLLGATFIILLFYPSAIFDVGLQLSFLSVGSIVFFCELFNPVSRNRRYWHYFMGAVLTTIIATFTTWIVVAYYFNTVPILFLPANLLVLPLLPLFMVISLVWLLLNIIGFDSSILAWLVENIHWLISFIIDLISSLSKSEINLKVSLPIVFSWLGGIITFGIYITDRKKRWAIGLSLTLFLFTIIFASLLPVEKDNFFIIQNHHNEISMVVYNDGSESLKSFPEHNIGLYSTSANLVISLDILPKEEHLSDLIRNINNIKTKNKYIIIGKNFPADSIFQIPMLDSFHKVLIHPGINKQKEKSLLLKAKEAKIKNLYSLREEGPLELNF